MTSVQVTAIFCAAAWVAFLALMVYLFNRCGHQWQPLVERELPSVSDVIGAAEVQRFPGVTPTYKAGRRKFFAIIGCKKCGKTKIFETMSGADL